MIDAEGFRANVGIILCNGQGRVLLARRCGQEAWQFPQGGINRHETPEQALFRELHEEVGLHQRDVEMVGCTRGWLRYRLPRRFIRRHSYPLCIGQKQRWFMLRLLCDDERVRLDLSAKPEFDRWCWVNYWAPLDQIIFFKRRVYERALSELAPLIFPDGTPCPPTVSRSIRPRPHRPWRG